MNNSINQILNDLYSEDASLREHDAALRALINEIIKAQPDSQFDEAFRVRLRNQLLSQINSARNLAIDSKIAIVPKVTWWQRFSYGGVGALVIVLAFVAWQQTNLSKQLALKDDTLRSVTEKLLEERKMAFEPKIIDSESGAFDDIIKNSNPSRSAYTRNSGMGGSPGHASFAQIDRSNLPQPRLDTETPVFDTPSTPPSSTSTPEPEVFMFEVVPPPAEVSKPEPKPDPSTTTEDSSYIKPSALYQSYKYVYQGEPLNTKEGQMAIYKRVDDAEFSENLAIILQQTGLSLGPISKLEQTQVDNITLSEDRDFGYTVNFFPQDQSISFDKNRSKWPQRQCSNIECNEESLSLDQIPSDTDLVWIAQDFLKKYGIETNNYAPAIIDDSWKNYSDGVLETVPVIFPLLMDNTMVYGEAGLPSGLNVNVDIREKLVASMWNARSLSFERSFYDVVADSDTIIAQAEAGGMYPYYDDNDPSAVEVTLGTPALVFMQTWLYSETDAQEFIVPAYRFPIENVPDNVETHDTAVMVPIIKDFFQQINDFTPPVLE